VDVRSFFGRAVMLPAGLVERIDSTENRVSVDRKWDEIKDAARYDDRALADHFDYWERLGNYYSSTYVPPGDQARASG
jgi:hypothetical protein